MKSILIHVFKFSVVSVVFFFALTIGYGIGANAYLAVSIAGLIFSALGLFRPLPQLLISNRATAAALMLLSVLGLASFNTLNMARLTELRATNPHAYLEGLRVSEDRELYIRELKTLDPTEYKAELARQNRIADAKAAEDKRIEESNKKWFDTLKSATLAAMVFDPYLKYEFGVFHPLDLTLSSLNAATANAIANQLCSTYHLRGGLRVYLTDGHLAARCEFLPPSDGKGETPNREGGSLVDEAERKKILDEYASALALDSPDAALGYSLRHCDAQWHRQDLSEDWTGAETCRRKVIVDADSLIQKRLDAIVPPPAPDELAYVHQRMREFSTESSSFYDASKFSDDCILNRVAHTYGWHGSMEAAHEIGAYCAKAVKARFPKGVDDLFADELYTESQAEILFPCRSLHPNGQEMICNPTPEQDSQWIGEREKMNLREYGVRHLRDLHRLR